MKKHFLVQAIFVIIASCFSVSCVNTSRNNGEQETKRPTEITISFKVEELCKRTGTVHVVSYENCPSVFKVRNHDWITFFCTDDIVIPDGQTWIYKNHYSEIREHGKYGDRQCRGGFSIFNGKKEYRLPEEGRNVVFYPGDKIHIGTDLIHDVYAIEFTATFFIDYLD